MKLAYIIGPYRADTIYQIKKNIEKAEETALKYWKKGYAVICPHLNTAFLTASKMIKYGLRVILRYFPGVMLSL